MEAERKSVLILSAHVCFPRVTGGNERLVQFLADSVLAPEHDVWIAHVVRRRVRALYRNGVQVAEEIPVAELIALAPRFAISIDSEIHHGAHPVREVYRAIPSFVVLQTHPSRTVPDASFRGVVTHRSRRPQANVLTLGGAFDPAIFAPRREAESAAVCVGRICPEKNQLELARGYRERIWSRYGVPLLLVGGPDEHAAYFADVLRYVDGEAVHHVGWSSAADIATILNRARFFVSPSPRETFGIALVEALACGTTAVVNGRYTGFAAAELAPHVYGNVSRRNNSTLDVLERAFEAGARIDASQWAQRYSVAAYRDALLRFIDARL